MGDVADDAFDAAMREEEMRQALLVACETPNGRCSWLVNDEGLYECRTCGKEIDL